jgi:hypothetical protein
MVAQLYFNNANTILINQRDYTVHKQQLISCTDQHNPDCLQDDLDILQQVQV